MSKCLESISAKAVGIRYFLSYSHYDRLVDLKKLGFVFCAIHNYAFQNNFDLSKLLILEVGCGEGGITLPLGALGCFVRSFDINEKAVQLVKAKVNQEKFQNVVVSVDNGYTFNDGKYYDIVIASEVLEHVENPNRLIENISKRMKKGGFFIVTVPNGFGPWELVNRVSGRLYHNTIIRHALGKEPYSKVPGEEHLQFYRMPQLLSLLSHFSFHLVNFFNSDSFLAVCWIFKKLCKQLQKIDITLADLLPHWFASGWYLLLIKE